MVKVKPCLYKFLLRNKYFDIIFFRVYGGGFKMKKVIFLSALTLVISYSTSYSQTTGTGQLKTPQSSPAQFPEYIVKPSEDLNPYGFSSLGESTEVGYRDGAGTLSSSTISRPSNVEVNKAKEERKKQKASNNKEIETQSVGIENTVSTKPTQTEYNASRKKVGNTQMIKWTDDNGVVNISNNMGAIPPKYRKQLEEQGESERYLEKE